MHAEISMSRTIRPSEPYKLFERVKNVDSPSNPVQMRYKSKLSKNYGELDSAKSNSKYGNKANNKSISAKRYTINVKVSQQPFTMKRGSEDNESFGSISDFHSVSISYRHLSYSSNNLGVKQRTNT